MAEGSLSKFFDKLLDPKKKKASSTNNHSSSVAQPANGNHLVQQAGVGQQLKQQQHCSSPSPLCPQPLADALSSGAPKQLAPAAAGQPQPCPLCSQPADVRRVHHQPAALQEEPMNFNGTHEERRAWIDTAQDKVSMALCACAGGRVSPCRCSPSRPLLRDSCVSGACCPHQRSELA